MVQKFDFFESYRKFAVESKKIGLGALSGFQVFSKLSQTKVTRRKLKPAIFLFSKFHCFVATQFFIQV